MTFPLPKVEMKDEGARELGNRWTRTISCWALASENMQLASHCFSGGFSGWDVGGRWRRSGAASRDQLALGDLL